MSPFLIVFDETTISRGLMIETLDQLDGVQNWLSFLPTTIAVVSNLSSHALTASLSRLRPGVRFLISPIDASATNGMMPKQVWAFLNNPQPAEGTTDHVKADRVEVEHA